MSTTHFSGPVDSANGFTVDGADVASISSDQGVTATSNGLTTAIIDDDATFVTVSSPGASNIVKLPTPTPGRIVYLTESTSTGYELRATDSATVAINGGTGASAESAVSSTFKLVKCVCNSATSWICTTYLADGTAAPLEAAA